MPDTKAAVTGEKPDTADYQRGYDDGFRAACERFKPGLFEACKAVMERFASEPDRSLLERVSVLEEKYGERLIQADKDLLLRQAARRRETTRVREQMPSDLRRPRHGTQADPIIEVVS